MQPTTVRWVIIDNLMISLVTPGEATETEFNAWMKEFTTKPFSRYLATSVGLLSLNSVQRKQIAEAMKKKAAKTAVVTDETIIRGVVTALSWMGANIKAFDWDNIRDALKHLNVTPETEERAINAVLRMRSAASL